MRAVGRVLSGPYTSAMPRQHDKLRTRASIPDPCGVVQRCGNDARTVGGIGGGEYCVPVARKHRNLRVGRANILKYAVGRRRMQVCECGTREHFKDDSLRTSYILVLEALSSRQRQQS